MTKQVDYVDKRDRVSFIWTMQEIAREVGVSTKTVSRVVNGEPGVRESTRSRVSEFIERVGYHPHVGARSMRSQYRDCIGCTIPAPMSDVPVHEDFFIRLFSHLYRVFGSRGKYICFDLNPYFGSSNGDYARGLFEGRFAGCVLCGPLSPDDTAIHRIHGSGLPYLAFGRLDSLPECSSAAVDYEAAMRLSVSHLIGRGHKRIGVLKGFHGYQPGEERRRGFIRAHADAGVKADESLLADVSFAANILTGAVHRLLLDPTVTALIDSSGAEDAASIREGCRLAGRKPGENVEIVAWTYSEKAAVLPEAVAHVWLPVWEAATEGLERLAGWFDGDGDGPIHVLYPPTLSETLTLHQVLKPQPLFDVNP